MAEAGTDTQEFKHRARLAASSIPESRLSDLPAWFHDPPPKPASLDASFNGLGHWLAHCQLILFEILYAAGPVSVPILQQVAHGPYDWTQITSIRTLCRMASEGVDPAGIVDDLAGLLPALREEALFPAAEFVCSAGIDRPLLLSSISGLIRESLDHGYDEDAADLISSLALLYPEEADRFRR